jgi:uncharacterized membrane protein YoaT (DUF817 family)
MYHIWTNGRHVKSILGSSAEAHGYNHYIKLFALSGIDIFITIPNNIWYFTTFFKFPLSPWPGWKFIHSGWSKIALFTSAELRNIGLEMFYQSEVTRWMCVIYGLVFFGLFGVTAEARERYTSAWQFVSTIVCWKTGFLRELSGYMLRFILFLRSN